MLVVLVFVAFLTLVLFVVHDRIQKTNFDFDSAPVVPLPPRPLSSLLSYIAGNQIQDFDTTLMASCDDFFTYIIKYVDYIPTNWAAETIRIAVQKSGFTGQNITDAIEQITFNPTKAKVVDTCKKIRPMCKFIYSTAI